MQIGVAVACRLMAIYLLFKLINYSFDKMMYTNSINFDSTNLILSILVLSIGLIAIFLLWRYPVHVAKSLIPLDQTTSVSTQVNASDWFRMGVVLMGLWICVNTLYSVTHLAWDIVTRWDIRHLQPNWSWYIQDIFNFVVGLLLMFGSRKITHFFGWFREFGLKDKI